MLVNAIDGITSDSFEWTTTLDVFLSNAKELKFEVGRDEVDLRRPRTWNGAFFEFFLRIDRVGWFSDPFEELVDEFVAPTWTFCVWAPFLSVRLNISSESANVTVWRRWDILAAWRTNLSSSQLRLISTRVFKPNPCWTDIFSDRRVPKELW